MFIDAAQEPSTASVLDKSCGEPMYRTFQERPLTVLAAMHLLGLLCAWRGENFLYGCAVVSLSAALWVSGVKQLLPSKVTRNDEPSHDFM